MTQIFLILCAIFNFQFSIFYRFQGSLSRRRAVNCVDKPAAKKLKTSFKKKLVNFQKHRSLLSTKTTFWFRNAQLREHSSFHLKAYKENAQQRLKTAGFKMH